MSIHIHTLDGCAPQPLAAYLKALGILRLVAEQADPSARGWWQGDHFRLATTLDREELIRFFLMTYQPTPLVEPWNKGSGFFAANDPVLRTIEKSQASRLEPYRQAIASVRGLLDRIAQADSVIRAIKARTKTNRSFQTEEQRTLLAGSEVFQSVIAELKSEGAKNEEKEARALVAPAKSYPDKREAKAIKESPGYKKMLAAADRLFKAAKSDLIPACRKTWRGKPLEWMECALVLNEACEVSYPALLGTGGNDGKLDFTYKFMQRLDGLFDLSHPEAEPRAGARAWLAAALYGIQTFGLLTGKEGKVGQFLPCGAGGANCTTGFGGQDETLLNPFDYVLMLEGAIMFASALTRRGDVQAAHAARASAPFAVSSAAAGYASAASKEESFRGEQWMPLWSQPATLGDIRKVLAEGRAQSGRATAKEPLDLARAAAGLGTARGIVRFVRYGYLERNGQSNLAVPLGFFDVATRPSRHIACLDDLALWLIRLRRQARDEHAPDRLKHAERQLSDALFAVLQHASEPARWQSVLMALAEVETVMAAGSGFQAGPVPALRPAWAEAADDGSPEFRLALAFALQAEGWDRWQRPVNGIRRHWLPLDRTGRRFLTHSEGGRPRLMRDPGVVMMGREGLADAIALLERRLLEAGQSGRRVLALRPAPGAAAHLADLAALITGRVDLGRVMALARALMALDGRAWALRPASVSRPAEHGWPDDLWLGFRLAFLPWPLQDDRQVPVDPAAIRRLAAGDCTGAWEIARRRLRAAGLTPAFRAGAVDPATARLWAAALAFPIAQRTVGKIVQRVGVTPNKENDHDR